MSVLVGRNEKYRLCSRLLPPSMPLYRRACKYWSSLLGCGMRSRTPNLRPHLRLLLLAGINRLPLTSACYPQASTKLRFAPMNTSRPRHFNFTFAPTMISGQRSSASQNQTPQSSIHSHTNDTSYLTSANKQDAGVRITRLGLYSNIGMAMAKAIGGYAFNSQAMIADAWHSLTDMASDILTLTTISCSRKPPTDQFPTGYGKIESLGALGVSGMLLIGGCFMCYHSCEILYVHFFHNTTIKGTANSLGHAHGLANVPSLHAVWLALGTVFLKEWLYHATMKVAKKRKSSVLASNAIHHRVDSLTSVVALFAIIGSNFIRDAQWLDPVGGFVISLLVIKGGWANTISALYELADADIGQEVKLSIRQNIKKCFEDIRHGSHIELQNIEGLKSGQNYLVNVQLAVPPTWSIQTMAEIENELRKTVGSNVRGVRRVQIRFVSKEDNAYSFREEFISCATNQDLEEISEVTELSTPINSDRMTDNGKKKQI